VVVSLTPVVPEGAGVVVTVPSAAVVVTEPSGFVTEVGPAAVVVGAVAVGEYVAVGSMMAFPPPLISA
jgi:hypothetical protein